MIAAIDRQLLDAIFAFYLLVFCAAALRYVYHVQCLSRYLNSRYLQILDDSSWRRNLFNFRYWMNHLVFAHRQLKAELAAAGIEDAVLEARIESTVFWNRLSILLYLAAIPFVVAIRW